MEAQAATDELALAGELSEVTPMALTSGADIPVDLRLYEPEMDDETADTAERIAEGHERVEPETITTGHFVLSDDTARYRRTFGIAPSLMTPWEIGLYDHDVTSGTHFHLTARYDDLERERGQYRAVVLGLQFGQTPAPETAPTPE